MTQCPLCEVGSSSLICKSSLAREFFRCQHCDLVFAEPQSALSSEAEKSRYATHENQLNEGYRKFLNQMWEPVKHRLSQRAQAVGVGLGELKGLDFGCGPSHAFAELAAESGVEVASYDPYFSADTELLNFSYDFIWCSEVVEHFNSPAKSFAQLAQILDRAKSRAKKEEGPRWQNPMLAVMTEKYPPIEEFADWYYHRDPTHMVFYSDQCFTWLAKKYSWSVEFLSPRVTIFGARE